MRFEDLLRDVGDPAGREELKRLGREYADARRLTRQRAEPQAEARCEATLGEMVDKIKWHFRDARYAVPNRRQLEEMLDDDSE